MIKKIKYLIYLGLWPLYKLIEWTLPVSEVNEKSILLMKMDSIGDYILFRNFIEVLKSDSSYREYKITLCGNSSVRQLAEGLDRKYIENFIWVDRLRFCFNLFYRYKTLKALSSRGYEVVIQPSFSRDFFVEDAIVKVVSAKKKITSFGNTTNSFQFFLNLGNRLYDQVVPISEKIRFEFLENKEFFQKLLRKAISLRTTFIDMSNIPKFGGLPPNFVVVFPGAHKKYRCWPIDKYAEVIRHIISQYDCHVVVCGGPSEKIACDRLIELVCSERVQSLAGRTSLIDLVSVISQGRLLISNETSAPHIAAAVGTPVVVISQGNHLLRFSPYPEEMGVKYKVVYHPYISSNEMTDKFARQFSYRSTLDISEIKTDSVIQVVDQMLSV